MVVNEKHVPVDEVNFENIEVVDDEADLQLRCPVVIPGTC